MAKIWSSCFLSIAAAPPHNPPPTVQAKVLELGKQCGQIWQKFSSWASDLFWYCAQLLFLPVKPIFTTFFSQNISITFVIKYFLTRVHFWVIFVYYWAIFCSKRPVTLAAELRIVHHFVSPISSVIPSSCQKIDSQSFRRNKKYFQFFNISAKCRLVSVSSSATSPPTAANEISKSSSRVTAS
jgi:hypothetical protein